MSITELGTLIVVQTNNRVLLAYSDHLGLVVDSEGEMVHLSLASGTGS